MHMRKVCASNQPPHLPSTQLRAWPTSTIAASGPRSRIPTSTTRKLRGDGERHGGVGGRTDSDPAALAPAIKRGIEAVKRGILTLFAERGRTAGDCAYW